MLNTDWNHCVYFQRQTDKRLLQLLYMSLSMLAVWTCSLQGYTNIVGMSFLIVNTHLVALDSFPEQADLYLACGQHESSEATAEMRHVWTKKVPNQVLNAKITSLVCGEQHALFLASFYLRSLLTIWYSYDKHLAFVDGSSVSLYLSLLIPTAVSSTTVFADVFRSFHFTTNLYSCIASVD